jgi:tetratricopeptide (TPR) repeat protein
MSWGFLCTNLVAIEVDTLFEKIDQLLADASAANSEEERLRIVDAAIGRANRLVELEPENANAHHVLSLCWYHHPSNSLDRSHQIRRHLEVALGIDPSHQFANQYLGYINFDEGRFAEALACFERTDFNYFESLDQSWKALKARELIVVSKLRLGFDFFDLQELTAFIAAYRKQFSRDETNTVWPLELSACAEWLSEHGVLPEGPVVSAIVRFFDEIGFPLTMRNQRLVGAWPKGLRTATP